MPHIWSFHQTNEMSISHEKTLTLWLSITIYGVMNFKAMPEKFDGCYMYAQINTFPKYINI